jgi:DNA-binding NtrC family response regulator
MMDAPMWHSVCDCAPDMNITRNVPAGSSRRPRLPVLPTAARSTRAGAVSEPARRFGPSATSPPLASSASPPNPVRPEARAPVSDGEGVAPATGFHGAVTAFKRRLIERTLTELGGNRTRAARALGLQRTYLLRLMREFGVHVPSGAGAPRQSPSPERSPPQTA